MKNALLISAFPNGGWVISGVGRGVLTQKSTQSEVQKFLAENGVAHDQVTVAAIKMDWTSAIDNRIAFDKDQVTDDEVRLALDKAQQKFGNKLKLCGEDPAFTARIARLADDMGLTVLNPELEPVVLAHRAALARLAPNMVPTMSKPTKTQKWWTWLWAC